MRVALIIAVLLITPGIGLAFSGIIQYDTGIKFLYKYYDHDEGVICYTHSSGISCVKDNYLCLEKFLLSKQKILYI